MRAPQAIKDRLALLDVVHARGARVAVEIGTYAGEYAEAILQRTGVDVLYCVDPWAGTGMRQNWDGDEMYARVRTRLAPYGNRVILWRMTSMEAAEVLARRELDSSSDCTLFDFIYIDGLHDYVHAREDAATWRHFVREGGILAGHDYKDLGRRKQVKRAVAEVFPTGVNVTGEACPSWWRAME